ncbi:MAG: peptidase M28 [Crocinitomicaceae bacterium]|nr:peptidase M28 [Crocinitomicaceae bacterium]|tara:strand:- start:3507 stop:4841 length:1335 start_codon:yes stop_codon:yes gene_type:complete
MRIVALMLAVGISWIGNAQQVNKTQEKFDKYELKLVTKDVKVLSNNKMEGRETGTNGEKLAAEYIAKRMKEMRLKPYGIGGYFQEFTFTPRTNPHAHGPDSTKKPITGKNVIGYWDNGAEHTIVIGAHYDHLGYGGEGSLHPNKNEIHNGADDNASGIAGLLSLARTLPGMIQYKNNNYLFIAFSGEEKGLWGSKSFIKNPTIPLSKINYMINMDMIGRLDSNKLAINGVGTSTLWPIALDMTMNRICVNPNALTTSESDNRIGFDEITTQNDRWNLVLGKSGIGPSDHTSFYLEGIPVLHFFTGQHSDYHKPGDDFEKVNMEGIVAIRNFIISIIGKLDKKGKLDYVKTKSDKSSKAPRFKVTLGVMPDYMFQGEGMRIDGVIPDRPAEKAGLKKGDVVVKMGEVEINDMHSYMKGLAQYESGDTTQVEVIRNNNKIKVDVTF